MANYDLFNFLLPFGITETLTGDFPPPVQGLPSYFNVAITNGGFLEGSYDGWCLRSDRPVELTTYSALFTPAMESSLLGYCLPRSPTVVFSPWLCLLIRTSISMPCKRSIGF